MKFSLSLQNDNQNQNHLLKAKIPISIFDQPFTSIFTTTTTNSISDLSVSLSTNFSSGPSLKLTYAPSIKATAISPFSLSFKSGLGILGSPCNSPLTFSAQFSLSNSSPNVILPTFSLQFKPEFGHFSIHKRTTAPPNPICDPNGGSHATIGPHLDPGSPSKSEHRIVFASDGSMGWQELKLEPSSGKEKEGFANPKPNYIDGVYVNNGIRFLPERHLVWNNCKKDVFLSGVGVNARTVLPLSKRVMVNLRWGVNLPGDLRVKWPYLTVNKIGIERLEEEREVKNEKSNQISLGDLELLRGMCFWMTRDLQTLEKENKKMREYLEDVRLGISARTFCGESKIVGKRMAPSSSGSLGEFEQSRGKKHDGEGNGQRELKKPANKVTDLESELQKAIKAASS